MEDSRCHDSLTATTLTTKSDDADCFCPLEYEGDTIYTNTLTSWIIVAASPYTTPIQTSSDWTLERSGTPSGRMPFTAPIWPPAKLITFKSKTDLSALWIFSFGKAWRERGSDVETTKLWCMSKSDNCFFIDVCVHDLTSPLSQASNYTHNNVECPIWHVFSVLNASLGTFKKAFCYNGCIL